MIICLQANYLKSKVTSFKVNIIISYIFHGYLCILVFESTLALFEVFESIVSGKRMMWEMYLVIMSFHLILS